MQSFKDIRISVLYQFHCSLLKLLLMLLIVNVLSDTLVIVLTAFANPLHILENQ